MRLFKPSKPSTNRANIGVSTMRRHRKLEDCCHFFKIIHASIIQDQRLGIPRKFVRKFGEELSDFAALKVPSGSVWHVELCKAKGEVWFKSGWQEFIEYHSICVGHFLVFRYDGNSQFYVLIFDMSASEIEYPFDIEDFEEPKHERGCSAPEKEEEDNSLEILDVSPPCQTPSVSTKEVIDECEDEHERRCLAPEKEETQEDNSVEILDVSPRCQTPSVSTKEVIDECEDQQTTIKNDTTSLSRIRTSLRSNVVKGIESTCDSESRLYKWSKSSVPFSESPRFFARNEKKCNEDGGKKRETADGNESNQVEQSRCEEFTFNFENRTEVILIHSDSSSNDEPNISASRKSSSIRANKDELNPTENMGKLKMSRTDGVESHCLKRGSGTEEFSIRRVNQRAEPDLLDFYIPISTRRPHPHSTTRRRVTTQEKERAIKAARAFKSENPFFMVIMRPSHVDGNFVLNVPFAFAKSYLKEELQSVILRVSDRRTWHVYCVFGDSYVKLFKGWELFASDNYLEEGDVCIFELVRSGHIELNVVIFRVREDVTLHSSRDVHILE